MAHGNKICLAASSSYLQTFQTPFSQNNKHHISIIRQMPTINLTTIDTPIKKTKFLTQTTQQSTIIN